MELEHPIFAATKKHADLLTTAGGRLVCARCTAKSKTTGLQFGRPALEVSKTQKCQCHGGWGNSGAKTPEGKARAVAAHTKTGDCSQAARDVCPRLSSAISSHEASSAVVPGSR
jgi:hypothetical protein